MITDHIFFCFVYDSYSSHECNQVDYNKENLLLSINYDVASKKRKKDLMNNNSKVPCKWQQQLMTKKKKKSLYEVV